MSKSRRLLCFLSLAPLSWLLLYVAVRSELKQDSVRLPHKRGNALFRSFEKAKNITYDDVHITVKTTKKYHKSRLSILMRTWIKTSPIKVNVITDGEDEALNRSTAGPAVIVTDCGDTHNASHLCCKTGREFITFMEANKTWWCHFDDDMYVNTRALLRLLQGYSSNANVYVGRRSFSTGFKAYHKGAYINIQFATGASYCITRTLANCMEPMISGNNMVETCKSKGIADDGVIAFVSTAVCHTKVTENFLFHSQFEDLSVTMNNSVLDEEVSFPYRSPIPPSYKPSFYEAQDKTHFLSIHCLLHPKDDLCPGTFAKSASSSSTEQTKLISTKLSSSSPKFFQLTSAST